METRINIPEDEKNNDLAMGGVWWGDKKVSQILVVDDEARIREIYRTIFRMMGFRVFTAANATDACVALAAEEIDIVILDIKLDQPARPVLFDVIRHFCKNAKIIVASVCPVCEQRKIYEHADGYFDKSDNNDVLVRMVCSFLDIT